MSRKLDMPRSKEKENKITSFAQILRKGKLTLEAAEWRKTSKVYGNRMLGILINKDFAFFLFHQME